MKVVFLDAVHSILEERLLANGFVCVNAIKLNYENCLKTLSNADGIVIRSRFKLNSDVLSNCHSLKFIARSGSGLENIDLNYCKKRGIKVYNSPEGNRDAVAEHGLGMLLNLFNNIAVADSEIRKGKWIRENNRGIELAGKTIGIIGFGNNGEALAKKLSGLNMQILAYDKYKNGFGDCKIKESSLEEIYEKANIVSFHIPQNEETINYANDDFFESFKDKIYLMNLSRGNIVNTSSLVKNMKNGKVIGACLDVLEYEKTTFEELFKEKSSPEYDYLIKSKNVILSPHIAGWTEESFFKLSNVLADKILNQFNPCTLSKLP